MAKIPEIIRSIILTKKVTGENIAKALEEISHCFGGYEQRLISDVDGSRTHDIGILKDGKYPQTGYIIGSILDGGTITSGITFDKKYRNGHQIIVANHRWEGIPRYRPGSIPHYEEYGEKKAIKAVESLRNSLGVELCR